MNDFQSLSHTTWDCKYHLVWIPKYRRKVLYGHLRRYLGDVLRELALHKESRVVEGHLIGDHVHMLILRCRGIKVILRGAAAFFQKPVGD
jgi:putative transposase